MKRKITYSLSALLLAMIISISGVGNSYIKAEASSGVFDVLWNTDATVMENIGRHMLLWGNVSGCFVDPTLTSAGILAINAAQFYDWMISDGYSEEVANEVVHGGGGFVRDGITRDSNGNVTYSDEVCDLFYKYICNYIDTESGYYVVETMAPADVPAEWFSDEILYTNFVQTCKNLDLFYAVIWRSSSGLITNLYVYDFHYPYFILENDGNEFIPSSTEVSNAHLNSSTYGGVRIGKFNGSDSNILFKLEDTPLTWDSFDSYGPLTSSFYFCKEQISSDRIYNYCVISSDGRLVRVYKNFSALNNSNDKSKDFYVSQQFYSYQLSNSNAFTLTNSQYKYYTDNSSTIFQNIQYNIDNGGSDLTEDDIQRIIDDELKKFKDNMKEEEKEDDNTVPDDDSGNDSGGGGSVSGNGTGGTGIGDFVGGLGSLLDFILSLLGKVIGLISDFLNSALELLGNLTSFTDGFSSFLTAAFGFLPEEAVTLICSGIALLITLGIIKYMRN